MNDNLSALLDNIGRSDMLTTAYDTAWVARLTEFDRDLGLPAMEWLCENQLPDGSWGAGQAYYYHDRVISTLSAMIALTKYGRRHSDKVAIEKGLKALEDITNNATRGLREALKGMTVGFEMIVPTLVAEAESLGIIKQQKERILGRISQQRAQKLAHLKGKMINRDVTMAFSAEMAGVDALSMLDLDNLQEKNGSVGCSPSATAYFVLEGKRGEPRAMEYLYKIRREVGGAPNVAPFDVFEIAWTLWNLSLVPGYEGLGEKALRHVDFLSKVWDAGGGAGFSSEYSVNDSDETSVVFESLLRFGNRKNIGCILAFESKEWFKCFPLERDPSISANIHVLGALRAAGKKVDDPSIQKILHFLRSNKNMDGGWDDKWHISPYYTTSHAIIACAGFANELVKGPVEWLIKTQHQDGSWGLFTSTAEETAYALQALWTWNNNAGKIPQAILLRGKNWLENNEWDYSPLWIGKCLYTPKLVIDSAILSSLALVNQ